MAKLGLGVLLLSWAHAALEDLTDGFHVDVDETSVSAGFAHTCALQDDGREFGGRVVCWGSDSHGQASPPEGHFVQVSAGQFHTCGVKVDETVRCWGAPGMGSSPAGLFLQVSAGTRHSCGILKDGTVRCWGKNTDGQTDPPAGKYVQVSSGKDHSCALRDNGLAQCWGGGGSQQHGHASAPQDVQFKQISASFWHHSCGIDLQDDLHCWGADHLGQAPEFEQGPFEQVSAGAKMTCAIRRGTAGLACWGHDHFNVHRPPVDTTFEQVTVHSQHACGLTVDSSVECWGNPVHGAHAVPEAFVAA